MGTACGLPYRDVEIIREGEDPTCKACARIGAMVAVHQEWCRHHDAMVEALGYKPRRFETAFAVEKNTPALLAFEEYARSIRAKADAAGEP